MNSFFLFLVCFVACLIGYAIAKLTRGIVFFGIDTDSEKQVYAAANSNKWRWPSDMHKYGKEKARMKDVGVLGLALMQRLLLDKTSEYPLTLLCNFAVSVSTVLIFLVFQNYFNLSVGLLSAILFITSIWPHQVTLGGGYQCLAQMFFLIAVYFLQICESAGLWFQEFCLFGAGVAIGLMMFSSASSRKFLPLFVGAFLFSQCQIISLVGWISPWSSLLDGVGPGLLWFVSILLITVMAVSVVSYWVYIPLVTSLYMERVPTRFNRLIKSRHKYPLERYLNLRAKLIKMELKFGSVFVLYFLASLMLSRSNSFYIAQIWIILGFLAATLFFTLPNFLDNIRGYFNYWFVAKFFGHFRLYSDHFKKIGKPVEDNMRGAGISWIFLFFWRMLPFHVVFFVLSCLFLVCWMFTNAFQANVLAIVVAMFFISLSPIIYGELTRCPQIARTYFPCFIGLLFFIAFGVYQFDQILLFSRSRELFWLLITAIVLSSVCWNAWMFLNDVLSSRMTATYLNEKLQTLGIKKFYTYDTPYNQLLVDVLPSKGEKYDIQFIHSINDVKSGYLVVPAITSKSVMMNTQIHTIQQGDFWGDPLLVELIDSKKISDYAVSSFKTFGSSFFWSQEGEVSTYRDLILGEINAKDRWRGLAWIVDLRKLHKPLFNKC